MCPGSYGAQTNLQLWVEEGEATAKQYLVVGHGWGPAQGTAGVVPVPLPCNPHPLSSKRGGKQILPPTAPGLGAVGLCGGLWRGVRIPGRACARSIARKQPHLPAPAQSPAAGQLLSTLSHPVRDTSNPSPGQQSCPGEP